jgi:hypothetical protein
MPQLLNPEFFIYAYAVRSVDTGQVKLKMEPKIGVITVSSSCDGLMLGTPIHKQTFF